MKPLPPITLLAALLASATPVCGAEVAVASAAAVAPVPTAVTGIRAAGEDLVVTVHVPPGHRRVTLEGRPRAQSGTWTPRAVQWSDGTSGELTFTLPLGDGNAATEIFRVHDESESELGLPASFFAGVRTFAPSKQADSGGTAVAPQTFASSTSTGVATMALGNLTAPGQLVLNAWSEGAPTEAVSPVDWVFVAGDQLLQLRAGDAQPPQLTLTSTADPETPLATLSLEAAPVVGADLHAGRLYLVQSRADSWRNDPVTVSNQIVQKVPQPPVQESVTNTVVETIPQPPLVSYVTVTNIIVFPPIPGNPLPQPPQTNIFERKIFTSQPPLLVTNEVVQIHEIPQPPLLMTNWVTATNWTSVRVPGLLRLSVIEAGTNTLAVTGQTTLDNPTNYYGAPLVARWPQDGVVVWTERADGSGPVYRGPILSFPGFTLNGGAISFIGNSSGFATGLTPSVVPVFWNSLTWWGSQTRLFLAFDVTDAAAPRLVSTTQLGDSGWSGYSDTFAADGKLYVSHDVTTYQPTTNQVTPVGNGTGSILFLNYWQPGAWETRHFLDVLDFADATNPVVRVPVEFPGRLQGLSHGGQLVYAAGQNPTNADDSTPYLHALAYDGVQASLVASLRRSDQWPQPLLVRADGGVLLGVPGATTNDVPALESWAVSTAGTFEHYATLPLAAPAEDLQAFGDLLVVPAGDAFLFYDATDSAALHPLGSGERVPSLLFDWSHADASPRTGLWLPGAGQGLEHVPIHP